MSVAKLNSLGSRDPMKSIIKIEEGNDSLDNFIKQAIGKEPTSSFSRAGDNPVQWIQLLQALDQQGTNKLSKGSKLNNAVDGKINSVERYNAASSFVSDTYGVKESFLPIDGSGLPLKGTKSASEQMQTLKIPEAVVAFAQAAAKANGEPEKYLPGWPLLSPPKVQMQKCDKCNREFCSPINYRRHIRVHRRSLNIGKNFLKNREFLAAFWDKLSSDEAKEIVSFDNVKLEEVPGSSIMKALTSFIRKPGFSSLTQVYVKAGAALLDVIQSRAYRFPLPSEELFSILDDASERTFLCAGTALSLHKFVFDGEAGKIGLEMRNLVACTSFLVEQKLVEAWLADKDAEALRCHKLLVEEEEAAQKRQADLLERKRLKKLRQKEQRAKEHVDGNGPEFKEVSVDSLEYATLPATEPHSHTKKSPSDAAQQSLEPVQLVIIDEVDARFDSEIDARQMDTVSCTANSGNYTSVEHQTQQGSSRWRRPASIARNGTANGFHSAQNHPPSKLGSAQKHGVHRDQQRATTSVNGQKVWTRKTKLDNDADDSHSRVQRELGDQPDEKEPEFLIGSISVVLGDCNGCGRSDVQQFAVGSETELTRSRDVQVPLKANPLQSDVSRARSKLWRPLGKQGTAVHNNQREADGNRDCGKPAEQSVRNGIFVHHDCCVVIGADSHIEKEVPDPRGQVLFCRGAAEVFLRQRWKEAIASEHVKLVLCPEADPPDSDCCDPSILCSAENRQSIVEPLASKAKFRGKPEKGGRLKYIPKHRNNT